MTQVSRKCHTGANLKPQQMRLFRYTLLTMGFSGVVASLYNMLHTQTLTDHTSGILAGLFLIGVSLFLKPGIRATKAPCNTP